MGKRKTDAGVLSSPGWVAVKRELDNLPVFTCANKDGMPLQYEQGGASIALFFADITEAKKELDLARVMHPTLDLDLLPFGLGKVYHLMSEGEAILQPSTDELEQAQSLGLPASEGSVCPLFGCLEMAKQGADGAPCLPLFMSYAEARTAVDEAAAALAEEGGDTEGLELVVMSLQRAVELLVTVPEAPAFEFVAPAQSLSYIQDYLK